MSFDWVDFLTLADALVHDPNSPGPEEASLRSAISRAYYAAFHVARNFGRDRGEFTPTETGQDHWLVKRHFISSSDRTRQKIGLDLDRLYDYRTVQTMTMFWLVDRFLWLSHRSQWREMCSPL